MERDGTQLYHSVRLPTQVSHLPPRLRLAISIDSRCGQIYRPCYFPFEPLFARTLLDWLWA